MLKKIAQLIGLDIAIMGGVGAVKGILRPVFEHLTQSTGITVVEKTMDRIIDHMVKESEYDETIIDKALEMAKPAVVIAWEKKLATFTNADQRELYRRLKCRETPEATLKAIEHDAGMTPGPWKAYQKTVIEDYMVAKSLLDHLQSGAGTVVGSLKAKNAEIGSIIDNASYAGESWLKVWKKKHGKS